MKTPRSSLLAFSLLASAAVFTLSASARAQRARSDTPFSAAAPLFGAQGQLVISSDAALTLRKHNDDGTHLELTPAFDYFIAPNLSLGGFVSITYDSFDNGHSTHLGIGPRIGYDILLSDLFTFWPMAGLSYGTTSNSTDDSSHGAFALNIFAPFLLHPVPHFFIGFGPFIDAGLGGDARTTDFGARLTIGGWL